LLPSCAALFIPPMCWPRARFVSRASFRALHARILFFGQHCKRVLHQIVTAPLLLLPISHVLRRNRFDNSEPKATTLLIAVEDNSTVMNAGAEALLGSGGGRYGGRSGRCVTVSSYLEAVGVLACHKAGVNLACLTPDVPSIRQMAVLLWIRQQDGCTIVLRCDFSTFKLRGRRLVGHFRAVICFFHDLSLIFMQYIVSSESCPCILTIMQLVDLTGKANARRNESIYDARA